MWFAQLGGDTPLAWGISYLIFSNMLGATCIPALTFKNVLTSGTCDFFATAGELLAQFFVAHLGNYLCRRTGFGEIKSVSGFHWGDDDVFHAAAREFIAVAFFLYLCSKQDKVNLPSWIYTLAAFYLVKVLGNQEVIFASLMFADLSGATILTYVVQFLAAVFVASCGYFFDA